MGESKADAIDLTLSSHEEERPGGGASASQALARPPARLGVCSSLGGGCGRRGACAVVARQPGRKTAPRSRALDNFLHTASLPLPGLPPGATGWHRPQGVPNPAFAGRAPAAYLHRARLCLGPRSAPGTGRAAAAPTVCRRCGGAQHLGRAASAAARLHSCVCAQRDRSR